MKKRIIIIFAIILLIATCALVFLNTSFGKLLTIKYRGFTEISRNVYLDQDSQLSTNEELLDMIEESQIRVTEFWGNIESDAIFILSDNQPNLRKLGLNVNSALTSTFVWNGAKSYIAIYIENVDTDILSHEMSHAELHKRIYEHRYSSSQLVPMWFDEGLAMQVDDREKYNEDAWEELMKTSNDKINLSKIGTTSQFFNENSEIRVNNYIVSRHEVGQWLETNGLEGLLDLIEGIQDGTSFDDLYDHKSSNQ